MKNTYSFTGYEINLIIHQLQLNEEEGLLDYDKRTKIMQDRVNMIGEIIAQMLTGNGKDGTWKRVGGCIVPPEKEPFIIPITRNEV